MDSNLPTIALFLMGFSGSPWRDLPEELGKWSNVYGQFRSWTMAGLWEDILEVLTKAEPCRTRSKLSTVQSFAPTNRQQAQKGGYAAASGRGCDANRIRKVMGQCDVLTQIPMCKTRKMRVDVDRGLYRLRKMVERCFNKLNNARRVATRCDRTSESYSSY